MAFRTVLRLEHANRFLPEGERIVPPIEPSRDVRERAGHFDEALEAYARATDFLPPDPLARAKGAFPAIRDHVLLPAASSVTAADERLAGKADPARAAALVPEEWADGSLYGEFLSERLQAPRVWADV